MLRVLALFLLFLWLPARAAASEVEVRFRDNFYDVVIHGRHCWIVGYYGTILHSADRGLTWTVQNSKTDEALFRVVFVDPSNGWVSGSYGTLLRTRDGGKSWEKQPTRTQEHLFGLQFLDARIGWATGSGGILLHTRDGGTRWLQSSVGEDIIANDVHFIDPNQGWVVGEFGRIYKTAQAGRTWIKQKSPIEVEFVSGESRNLFRLLVSDGGAAWAFGLDGSIVHSRGGQHWELLNSNGNASFARRRHHLFAAASLGASKWAVGERGTVLVSPAGNSHWSPVTVGAPPVSLNGVAFGADGLGLIVGNRGTILRTENGGKEWTRMRLVDRQTAGAPDRLP